MPKIRQILPSGLYNLWKKFADIFTVDVDPTKDGVQTAFEKGILSIWEEIGPEIRDEVLEALDTFAKVAQTTGLHAAADQMIADFAKDGKELGKNAVMTLLRIAQEGLKK